MSTYKGTRTSKGAVITVDGQPLAPRNDLWDHSPTGFEWGYGGSGPAQTALAILAHHFGAASEQGIRSHGISTLEIGAGPAADRAIRLHQPFKWAVVAGLPAEWSLDSTEIEKAIANLEG